MKEGTFFFTVLLSLSLLQAMNKEETSLLLHEKNSAVGEATTPDALWYSLEQDDDFTFGFKLGQAHKFNADQKKLVEKWGEKKEKIEKELKHSRTLNEKVLKCNYVAVGELCVAFMSAMVSIVPFDYNIFDTQEYEDSVAQECQHVESVNECEWNIYQRILRKKELITRLPLGIGAFVCGVDGVRRYWITSKMIDQCNKAETSWVKQLDRLEKVFKKLGIKTQQSKAELV